MKEGSDSNLPLSSAALHMLLALAGEDLHGYGIMQEIARQSEGIYKIDPARCTTICRSSFSLDGLGNWAHAGEMTILAGAITDSPMPDEMS